jgi:hypothetical protein
VPAVEQSSVEQVVESDYETYLKQRSLNAALAKVAVFAGVWFVLGALAVGVAVFSRPDPGLVGMDSNGREYPLVVTKMVTNTPGAKQ